MSNVNICDEIDFCLRRLVLIDAVLCNRQHIKADTTLLCGSGISDVDTDLLSLLDEQICLVSERLNGLYVDLRKDNITE